MSESKRCNCGSTNIETDVGNGYAVCRECGFVLQEQCIINETVFEKTSSEVLGQFVSSESSGGAAGFSSLHRFSEEESRTITEQNARKGITRLCMQLRMDQHVEESMKFYRAALRHNLTRGRKQEHNQAACVYIVCRLQQTPHLLIDISDVLQICVYELGRTYLKFIHAMYINMPSPDPCIYIMRFAQKLEFREKEREVVTTATRVLKRMQKDCIHSGRRPSGLCGAAILIAARWHEFNRTTADIVRIVKVHESTLRKRLMEFGDTPSSALTVDEFSTVDLEEQQDPPAFKAARKKDRERLQKLTNTTINELQLEIDKQLEDHKTGKLKKRKNVSSTECEDADRYIRQSNLNIIQHYYESSVDDPDEGVQDSTADVNSSKLVDDAELGPDMASMGLIFMDERPNESKDKANNNFENPSEEIPISDIDDEELDSYILSEKEVERKSALWNKVNAEYLVQQQEKEEKRLKEKEEGKPEKKRRRTISRKNRTLANTAGEAIEKMLQEKRISSKINYEVLKNLSIGSSCSSNNNQQQNDAESATTTTAPAITSELDGAISFNKPPMINSTSKIDNKVILPLKKSRSVKPNTGRPKNVNSTPQEEENEQLDAEEEINVPETSTYEMDSTEIVNENDDDLDEDVEPETTEMSLGQMLGRMHSSGYDEVEYDGEDY